MKRIDIYYDGHLYSVGGRDLDDLKQEIADAETHGGWIVVNDGEGARRDAHLRITPGTPITLIPIPADQ